MREDIVARSQRMTWGTGFHQSVVAKRAVFVEMTEAPAAGRGVLFGVLDHELNIRGRTWNERLRAAEDFVVFFRRDVTVVQSGNDRALRERKLPVSVGTDRHIVAQNGGETVKVAFFVGHGDQPPVAVSGRNLGDEDWGLSAGLSSVSR